MSDEQKGNIECKCEIIHVLQGIKDLMATLDEIAHSVNSGEIKVDLHITQSKSAIEALQRAVNTASENIKEMSLHLALLAAKNEALALGVDSMKRVFNCPLIDEHKDIHPHVPHFHHRATDMASEEEKKTQ